MAVVWTRHAEQRLDEWRRQMGVTRDEVEALVANPAQLVPGDGDALVAQARRDGGLRRVVFTREADRCRIVTLYWTSRVARYWRTP